MNKEFESLLNVAAVAYGVGAVVGFAARIVAGALGLHPYPVTSIVTIVVAAWLTVFVVANVRRPSGSVAVTAARITGQVLFAGAATPLGVMAVMVAAPHGIEAVPWLVKPAILLLIALTAGFLILRWGHRKRTPVAG